MENVMFVAFFCYCVLITAVTDGQQAGNVKIENCKDGFIDIRENAHNTILCGGFGQCGTLVWKLTRNDREIPVDTCGFSYCTVRQPDHFAVQGSLSHSTLFYQQYDREVDKDETVTCAIRLGSSYMSQTCIVNVINPATLSSCTVEEDMESRTVRGRCRFDHAYSFMRGFSCAWYQEQLGESKRLSGDITYDSRPQSAGGVCTFTSTDLDSDPGNYTYSIDFYPGPGNITVNVGNIDTPDVNSVPVEAIVGGIVAVVAIIVVLVVGVVVIRRKRRQKPAGSANGSGDVPLKENNDSEYAVVDKSRAKKGPASSANTSGSSPAHTTEGSDEYAVVDKSSSRHKAAKNVASGLSDAATSNACAQVDKSAKEVKVAEPEAERAAYAQVQKPKPTAKPKTSAKPTSNKDVTCRGAADDDEYHTLSHTRGSPHTQGQADLEPQYNHIGHD